METQSKPNPSNITDPTTETANVPFLSPERLGNFAVTTMNTVFASSAAATLGIMATSIGARISLGNTDAAAQIAEPMGSSFVGSALALTGSIFLRFAALQDVADARASNFQGYVPKKTDRSDNIAGIVTGLAMTFAVISSVNNAFLEPPPSQIAEKLSGYTILMGLGPIKP